MSHFAGPAAGPGAVGPPTSLWPRRGQTRAPKTPQTASMTGGAEVKARGGAGLFLCAVLVRGLRASRVHQVCARSCLRMPRGGNMARGGKPRVAHAIECCVSGCAHTIYSPGHSKITCQDSLIGTSLQKYCPVLCGTCPTSDAAPATTPRAPPPATPRPPTPRPPAPPPPVRTTPPPPPPKAKPTPPGAPGTECKCSGERDANGNGGATCTSTLFGGKYGPKYCYVGDQSSCKDKRGRCV